MTKLKNRRFFLKTIILTTASMMLPENISAKEEKAKEKIKLKTKQKTKDITKTLKLYNPHTNKKYEVVYFEKNSYRIDGLSKINEAFIDYRKKEEKRIDIHLADLLYDIQEELGGDVTFNIISGYRSSETNKMLRKKSKKVAKHSYHIKGKAVDINIDGVKLKKIKKIAMKLKKGGVGYYPKSGFVHVDTGPIRHWKG